MNNRRLRRLAVALVLPVLASLVGCGGYGWSSYRQQGARVDLSVRADQARDLRSGVVSHAIDVVEGQPIRLRNLAGRVELMHGEVDHVQVRATVYARGRDEAHTASLLESMRWTESVDGEGRGEWSLSWPVDRHRTFHYSIDEPFARGFRVKASETWGGPLTVTTEKAAGVPTLFADVSVTYPSRATVSMRSLAGGVTGGELGGSLSIATVVGDVGLGSFRGSLYVDTGSGHIVAGAVDGTAHLDTGSGDVIVESIVGSAHLDTGSGDVKVASLSAEADVDTGSGDVVVTHVDSNRVRADTGSGDIVFGSGSVNQLVADTGSGRIEVTGVEFVRFHGDTGSGAIVIHSSLAQAEKIHADTGSGDVTIVGGPDASFDLHASLGSGRVRVGYDDAQIKHDGRWITGARRGDGRTRIHVDTGSGDCTIKPGA